jgi:hypothetical protein
MIQASITVSGKVQGGGRIGWVREVVNRDLEYDNDWWRRRSAAVPVMIGGR